MVREIVHVQVRQCANQIGNAFWNTMSAEHKLAKDGKLTGNKDDAEDARGLDKINVYFKEARALRFMSRAALVDLKLGSLHVIKGSPIGTMFRPDNFVFGAAGAGNSWAKRHYSEGAESIDEVVDAIRKEAESCDCPHSLGGGTGSGLGTSLLMKITDNYPDNMTATFSVYQSPKVSDI